MYKRILTAIDGSPCSDQALDEAIGIAAALHAVLKIVHVVDSGFEDANVRANLVKTGETLLSGARAKAEAKNVHCQTVLFDDTRALGDTASQIRRVADDFHTELIVIGTHGRHGMQQLLMGSIAQRVVRECQVPVLLVKAREN